MGIPSVLFRLLKKIKNKIKKPPKEPSPSKKESVLGDYFFEISIQVRKDGEFAVSTYLDPVDDSSGFVAGATLYMLNAGILADYFVDAMALRVESEDISLEVVEDILAEWKSLVDEGLEKKNQKDSISPVVSPEDVFGIRKVR